MSLTLYWIQCGACSGDSMSLLSLESPDIAELAALLDLEVLWHPSLSNGSPAEHRRLLDGIIAGDRPLDILCVEGAVIQGPEGSGRFDTFAGTPKMDIVSGLARRAGVVVAVGTCASFGGVCASGEVEATGLQFHRRTAGGFLGETFRSGLGLPVVNLPGCPCHCDVVAGVLAAVKAGVTPSLNKYNAPLPWYGTLVHQGCVRNEYHEYRVEERDFGDKGCLFFHMGCRGPLAYGPCNKLLWNRRNSKTRAGVPCVGCTEPDFPRAWPFFDTRCVADVPIELPNGVDRAHYLAYKSMAAAAAPERLVKRKTQV